MQHIVLKFNILFFNQLIINTKNLKKNLEKNLKWSKFVKNGLSLSCEIQNFYISNGLFFPFRENNGRR